ncbi:MAG: hypothetical protein WCN98_19265 [Verrucomicrobiaceae bacterium]
MRTSSRIPRSNAAWQRFLLRAHLATEQEMAAQKQAQVRWLIERLKNEDRSATSGENTSSPDEPPDEA